MPWGGPGLAVGLWHGHALWGTPKGPSSPDSLWSVLVMADEGPCHTILCTKNLKSVSSGDMRADAADCRPQWQCAPTRPRAAAQRAIILLGTGARGREGRQSPIWAGRQGADSRGAWTRPSESWTCPVGAGSGTQAAE